MHDDTQNYPSVSQNYWFKRLYIQLNEPTIKNIIQVHNVVEPTNKKRLL